MVSLHGKALVEFEFSISSESLVATGSSSLNLVDCLLKQGLIRKSVKLMSIDLVYAILSGIV